MDTHGTTHSSTAEFEKWLRRSPERALVYALGDLAAASDHAHELRELREAVYAAYQRGEVHLVQRRCPDTQFAGRGAMFEYIATRAAVIVALAA